MLLRRSVPLAFLLFSSIACISQTAPPAAPDLAPGIVVERVGNECGWRHQDWPQKGDILLSWTRGNRRGDFRSPFDLWFLQLEERPFGPIVFQGLTGTMKKSWTMGTDYWCFSTRPNFSASGFSLYVRANRLARAGNLERAKNQWQDLARGSPSERWLYSWLVWHGAGLLSEADRWAQAGILYQEAMGAATQLDPRIIADLLRRIGSTFKQRGDLFTAENYYHRSLLKSKELGDENLYVASNLSCLGALVLNDDLIKAEEYFSQAVAIHERLVPNSFDLAHTLIWLGYLSVQRGELDRAEKIFQRAQSIYEKVGNSGGQAESLIHLGMISETRGDLIAAEESYRQVLVIEKSLGAQSRSSAQALIGISDIAFVRGQPTKSEYFEHKALAINQTLKLKNLDVATDFLNLGLIARERGDLGKAERYARKGLRLVEKIAPATLDLAGALTDLGDILLARGAQSRAEKCFQRALAIEGKLAPGSLYEAGTLQELGDLYAKAGRLSQAEESYGKAIAITKRLAPGNASLLDALGGLAGVKRRAGDFEETETLYAKTLELLESQTARLGGGADVRSGFRAKHQEPYREFVDLLIQQGKVEQAFAVLERSRARSLAEALAIGHVDIQKGVDTALLEQERSIRQKFTAKTNYRIHLLSTKHSEEELKALEKEIAELLSQYQDVEGQIRSASPAYAALTQPQPLNAKEVQEQLLDPDTLLLEYSLEKEHSYLFTLTPTTLKSYELPSRNEIERTSRRVYSLLRGRSRAIRGETRAERRLRDRPAELVYTKRAAQLSRMILGPVAHELQDKRLIIVSDGALAYVPFGVLPDPDTLKTNPVTPLIAQHEIVNLPSASVLALLRQQEKHRQTAPRAVAVLADPVFSKDDPRVERPLLAGKLSSHPEPKSTAIRSYDSFEADLPAHLLQRSAGDVGLNSSGRLRLNRLPYTREEAAGIVAVVPADQGMQALDFHASRSTAMSPDLAQYRIVHFATHGLLDSRHPELSGLVLSLVDEQGQRQNGFLELQDIYNLNLSADLVVLSACETGLGKEVDGEGLVGLTRGFMYAGASRVLASLWRVDDEATAQLMKKFYEGVLKDGKTPAQALREAQMWMQRQRKWRQPYYWAGFVIQGEWK